MGRYRRNPFHQFDTFQQICGDTYATGGKVLSSLKYSQRQTTSEITPPEPEGANTTERGDEIFDLDEFYELECQQEEDESLTPMSTSKRASDSIPVAQRPARKRGGRSSSNKSDRIDDLHRRQGQDIIESISKAFPYSMKDCLAKLRTIPNLTNDAKIAMHLILSQNNDNKATFLDFEGDLLHDWITFMVRATPPFQDAQVWG